MKKILIIFFILFSSCTKPTSKKEIINFGNNLSFEEFKLLVEKYANSKEFPDIDD
tara:strand:- start:187 stop:351 length:165 start_codon:yes stop_codon:yes gene_type:complete